MGPSVTALDVPEDVLSCFWDLAAIEGDKRADAAAKLLSHLQGAQKAGGAGGDAPASDDGAALDAALGKCAPLVAYSMRRLVKGLTSGRKGARQGFALALTAALAQLPCFGPDETLALVNSLPELAVGGGRDEYFGQLFGLGAIVRAKKLDPAAAVAVAEQAVGLAHKKSFLREAAATVIRELAEKNPECMGKVLANASELRAWLSAPADTACPEALDLALRLWRHMPHDLAKACQLLPACAAVPSASVFSQKGRNGKDKGDRAVAEATFAEAHLRRLLPVLRATTQGHPRMHIVWPTLLSLLLPGYTGEGTGRQTALTGPDLETFWTVLVETDIFDSPSHDRKYLGFALFGEIAAALKPDSVPALLTPNFLHALATHVSKKDSALRPVAQQCMEQLASAVAASGTDARAQALLAAERHGNGFLVKQLTAKRVTENVSDADVASRAQQLMSEYDALVADGDADGLARQKSVLSQLAGIAKRQQGGPSVAADIFKFLVDRGVLRSGTADGGDAFELASHCASLLVTTVDAASRAQAVAAQQRRKDDKAAPAKDPLETVAAYVSERLADGAEPAQEATEESDQARATLGALRLALEKLLGGSGLSPEQHKQAEALKHLAILLELHAVAHPATADPELAVDLQRVAAAVFPATAAVSKAKKGAKKAEEEDAPTWEDALVDIVLAILSRNEAPLPSAPLRDAAERLFKAYAAHVTATGVQDLLEVVARPLDDKEDEEEDEGMSDEEMEDADEEGESGSEGEDGSGSDEEGGESEEEEEGREEDAAGSGSDVDEDPDMTDEQMFRLDSQLGAYFASMAKGRDSRKLRQEAVAFKLRALACLEMVMKKAPESGLVVGMASPLLTALVAARKPSGDVALADRLGGILRNALARCKPEGAEMEIDEEELRAQLRQALYHASRHEDRVIQEAAAGVFVFLERTAFAGAEGVATEFVAAALDDFFQKKKTRLGRPFFQGLLRRLPEAAVAALPTVVKTCGDARNDFMRQEAFAMLELAVKAADGGAGEALRQGPEALAGALLAAVTGSFSKKQRRVEALKAVTAVAQTLEAKGAGLTGVLGAKRAAEVSAALAEALEANPKDVHLQRLADLVDAEAAAEEQPKAKKKVGAAAATAAGKKRAAGAAATARPAKKK